MTLTRHLNEQSVICGSKEDMGCANPHYLVANKSGDMVPLVHDLEVPASDEVHDLPHMQGLYQTLARSSDEDGLRDAPLQASQSTCRTKRQGLLTVATLVLRSSTRLGSLNKYAVESVCLQGWRKPCEFADLIGRWRGS